MWPVDDNAASVLMTLLHQRVRRAPDARVALIRVQSRMREVAPDMPDRGDIQGSRGSRRSSTRISGPALAMPALEARGTVAVATATPPGRRATEHCYPTRPSEIPRIGGGEILQVL